jgi:hypothetical protein
MGKNNRLPSTVTRSLSFRFDVLAAIDAKVGKVRSDRSSVINGIMEHVLGIMAHPELVGRNVPFVEDVDREWEKTAKELEREKRKESGIAKPGQLVKRPGLRK